MKYARIVAEFAEKMQFSLNEALDFFYRSRTYLLISCNVVHMHCLSDGYLSDELVIEYNEKEVV